MIRDFVKHEFEPVYNADSEILILGTFPSVKSRENNFYYGHPQNRFWKVIAEIVHEKIPDSIKEKKKLLLDNKIALWDVISSCTITGSSDSSIRDVTVNNLSKILESSSIRAIYANGAMAGRMYNKYTFNSTHRNITVLPSTSPANAAYTLDKLINAWKIIRI